LGQDWRGARGRPYSDRNARAKTGEVFSSIQLPDSVPIVHLTSSTEGQEMIEGYEVSVISYTQKPIAFSQRLEVFRDEVPSWLRVNNHYNLAWGFK
jgi:hypothetical protein